MNKQQQFIKLLFNPGEEICFAGTKYDTKAFYYENFDFWPQRNEQFFCINPLREKRLDSNVTAYRNILLEFDKISLEEQLAIIEKLPATTVAWSGSKSYHAIISLKTPLPNRQMYDKVVKAIYDKYPQVDKSTKNPSRLSRLGDGERDNGNAQTIVKLSTRVSNDTLKEWLGSNILEVAQPRLPEPEGVYAVKKYETKLFLRCGGEEGNRNNALFAAACDLYRCGYSTEEIINLIEPVNTLSYRETMHCLKSARKQRGKK